jgi:phage-related protein
MFSFILQNEQGMQLEFNGLGGPYQITDIDGLNPPEATINTSELALMDGQQFNSAKLQMRTIDIAFTVATDAPQNRVNVYRVLKTKKPIRVLYKSETRDVYIDGYVQALTVAYMDAPQVMTASILCPYPYWMAAQSIVSDLSQIISMFHFAFASTEAPEIVFGYIDPTISIYVENGGDVETGVIIELYASDTVVNPRVINYETGEYIQVNATMQAADLITIDTRAGQKTATLLRDGATSNVFNAIAQGCTWLQLEIGGTTFTYTAEGGATGLSVTIRHTDVYEGV